MKPPAETTKPCVASYEIDILTLFTVNILERYGDCVYPVHIRKEEQTHKRIKLVGRGPSCQVLMRKKSYISRCCINSPYPFTINGKVEVADLEGIGYTVSATLEDNLLSLAKEKISVNLFSVKTFTGFV